MAGGWESGSESTLGTDERWGEECWSDEPLRGGCWSDGPMLAVRRRAAGCWWREWWLGAWG